MTHSDSLSLTPTHAYIRIRINGETLTVAPQSTLSQTINYWLAAVEGRQSQQYVVALNQHFIPHAHYDNTELQENDDIELLSPMAGG